MDQWDGEFSWAEAIGSQRQGPAESRCAASIGQK